MVGWEACLGRQPGSSCKLVPCRGSLGWRGFVACHLNGGLETGSQGVLVRGGEGEEGEKEVRKRAKKANAEKREQKKEWKKTERKRMCVGREIEGEKNIK